MRMARIFLFLAIVTLLACTVAWLSPLPAQPSPQTLNLTFTTIDVPGAGYTEVFGVNSNGDMVGNYGTNTNIDSHGFKYSNGTFSYYDYPGEPETVGTGINDSGLIVGYGTAGATAVGFSYDGTSFTTIKDGNSSATYAGGVNNAGEIVGGAGSIGATKGFALLGVRFKTLKVPGLNLAVEGTGVNKFGTIVGVVSDATANEHGFLCRGNACQTLDFPGATRTEALGINDAGIVVGYYFSSNCLCSFAWKNGKFFSFSNPGIAFTGAAGINNLGQVVGAYTSDFQTWHGFVTNPITAADFP